MQNLNRKILSMQKPPKKRKSKFKLLLKIFLLLIIIGLAIFIPLRVAVSGLKDAQLHGKAIASAYQSQNFGQLMDEVSATKAGLSKSNMALTFLIWLKVVPVVGGYYGDGKNFISAGVDELKAVETILTELKPSEKELGFVGQPIAGNDRITQAVKILDKASPLLPKIQDNLKDAKEKVEGINVDKYPEEFRGMKLRSMLQAAKSMIAGAYVVVTEGKDAIDIAPEALGQTKTKNYLMLFQNDKEIRATGGFMTAYATLKMDKGQLDTTGSDDIYRLDERLLKVCETKICPLTPPDPIVKYLPEVSGKARSAWSMRDSNISPDVPTAAQQFEKMYQLLGDGLPFDGIMYIDSQVVEELIEVTGPIQVNDRPFSAEIDKRCNCPNIIYELEHYAEIAAGGEQDRKAILGTLMQQMLAKIIGAETEKLPIFIDTIVRLANHKHIMFYMHDEKTQQALSKLNWTGEIKQFDGDYLHINDSNFAGGKSNLYVDQNVLSEIKVKNGKVSKKITIEYKNPQKFDTWLNGINRDYVRVYVPKGSKLTRSKGSDVAVTTTEDLGKTVFEAFLTVRPENSRKLELEYDLPYQPSGDYKLLIQKQPGAKDFKYVIKINGSQKANFTLEQDKELSLDI